MIQSLLMHLNKVRIGAALLATAHLFLSRPVARTKLLQARSCRTDRRFPLPARAIVSRNCSVMLGRFILTTSFLLLLRGHRWSTSFHSQFSSCSDSYRESRLCSACCSLLAACSRSGLLLLICVVAFRMWRSNIRNIVERIDQPQTGPLSTTSPWHAG
jgi:hypothetical protein